MLLMTLRSFSVGRYDVCLLQCIGIWPSGKCYGCKVGWNGKILNLYLIQRTLNYIVRSESRCALIKCVGNDDHERLYRPETV
jgi:hypothetical protein